MADDRAYRIHLRFDPEASVYRAQVPELGIDAEADTRAEAVDAVLWPGYWAWDETMRWDDPQGPLHEGARAWVVSSGSGTVQVLRPVERSTPIRSAVRE